MSLLEELYPLEHGSPEEQLIGSMGIEVSVNADGHVTGTMPVAGNRQPMGILHGGANAVLAETVGSVAARRHAGVGGTAVGLSLTCMHLRAVPSGSVIAVARALHEGDRTSTYAIEIRDERDRLVCTAQLVAAIAKELRRGRVRR